MTGLGHRFGTQPGSVLAMPTVDQIRHRITRPTAVTSTVDGRDHRLSQQATTAGLVAGHGTYTALCGRPVVAASLVTPAGADLPGLQDSTAPQHHNQHRACCRA